MLQTELTVEGMALPDETIDDAPPAELISREELQLATRNHGMPLEGLRYPITPVGMHYVLLHYDIPLADATTWTLSIDGRVRRPITLSLDDVRARPAMTIGVTMECAGNGRALMEGRPLNQPWLMEAVATAEWTGTPLSPLLEEAGLDEGTVEIVFTGLDRGIAGETEQMYQRSLSIEEAQQPSVLLVYAMNGQPLQPQHGFPVRLLVPGWYGMASVKWLTRITAVVRPFDGYWQAQGYRLRQLEEEAGTPITRVMPRALMVPPGIPDFPSRRRFVSAGPLTLTGRAWSGWGPIESVEVSADDGASWEPSTLEPPVAPAVWQAWAFEWTARPGEHVLCCRARDAMGNEQPARPSWNLGGYLNNAVQQVPVTVR